MGEIEMGWHPMGGPDLLGGILCLALVLLVCIFFAVPWDDSSQPPKTNLQGKAFGDAAGPSRASQIPSSDLSYLWSRYDDVADANDELNARPGGVLAHNVVLRDFETWTAKIPFEMRLSDKPMTDCAAKTRKTCSAWSYLRSDLMPVVFDAPSVDAAGEYATPIVGIVVDTAVIYPLITTLGAIDSDTNHRSCCSNQHDEDITATFHDGKEWTVKPSTKARPGGEPCPHSCATDDERCRYNNSGGSVDVAMLGDVRGADGTLLGTWGTKHCVAREADAATACGLCDHPHLCVPAPGDHLLSPGSTLWAPYNVVNGLALNHVGSEASAFQRLYASETGALRDAFVVGAASCKFTKRDWKTWIRAVRLLYEAWFRAYKLGGTGSIEGISLHDRGEEFGANYNLGNPNWYYGFLENEVNLYVHPEHPEDTSEWQATRDWRLEDRGATPATALRPDNRSQTGWQDDLFRDSILGFFYVDRTCLEHMAPLDGVESTFDGFTVTNASERCFSYLCTPPGAKASRPVGYRDQSCYLDRVKEERERHIAKAKEQTLLLTEKFNTKYRSDGKRRAVAARFVGETNTFLNHSALSKVLRGPGFKGADVFKEIT